VDFFDRFGEETGLKGWDLELVHPGYLFVAMTREGEARQASLVRAQREWGLKDVEELTGDQARQRFPYLAPEVRSARFRQRDGWLNPRRLALGMAEASRAEFRTGQPVTAFEFAGDRVIGVRTPSETIHAATVVIAAGPLSHGVGRLAGLDLPLVTVRRHKLVIPRLAAVPPDAPMTIEFETGAHWRPALSGAFALWTAPAPAEEPSEDPPASSDFAFGLLDPRSDHALARVAPFWGDAWASPGLDWFLQAGYYNYTPDHRPLLGPSAVAGLVLNTGYSGHGIMGSIGGSRRVIDAITGRLRPDDNPLRPDRAMAVRPLDVL
jgi:sarcosine oxidase subunit beta